ncbi:molybdenum cofactor biosynthesis domain protein [Ketogulonicigenium robustum]|uniref:Molybdenum cofactor biosynthesis domain protein n=1 Tax=Ketogulonicigenium robustum TaxID=92947 RepID=A0A1W6NWU5_9RHOB|nr:molybdopterin-binding protein [Ketogulonicigenium robustum]ARO13669.1 molybdenum cofactor biosynthesis domain protein [Ketogulonicigenium robustum]
MPNPTAAIILIGDELLSGRTRDSNMFFLAQELTRLGIDLRLAQVIPDDAATITATVRDVAGRFDNVFTSGGIGPTHDDITADAVAAAFDRPIDVRADARAILEIYYADRNIEMNAARLRMARIPDGAILIENLVSAAPGFSIENVHVMAGVPRVFEAMCHSLLPGLASGRPVLSQTWTVMRGEGEIATRLAQIAGDHPQVSIGSYPFSKDGVYGTNVVVRGVDGAAVEAALVAIAEAFPA